MKATITENDIKLILVMNNKIMSLQKIKAILDDNNFDTSNGVLLDLVVKMKEENKVIYNPKGLTWNHKDFSVASIYFPKEN